MKNEKNPQKIANEYIVCCRFYSVKWLVKTDWKYKQCLTEAVHEEGIMEGIFKIERCYFDLLHVCQTLECGFLHGDCPY